MPKGFTYFIGLRYLGAKKQGFISVINFISIAGIALGVTALIVVISVMNGFHEDIQNRIIGTNAHVLAFPANTKEGIKNYQELVNKIEKIDHVTGAAPYFMGQVMLKFSDKIDGILLWGVIPESISKVNKLSKNIIKGDINSITKKLPGNEDGIIIGKELSQSSAIDIGDDVVIVSPVFKQTPSGPMPKMVKMKVVGIFNAGMYDYDSTFAYVSLNTAQELFEKGDIATGIAINADNIENAGYIATEIHRKFKNLWARDWMSMNKNLFDALKIEKIAMFIILVLIVLVAAFNIASTLIMVVMRKTKEIGILKSIGANNRDIMNIFIIQGVATGIIGSIIGFIIGVGICFYLKTFPISMPGGGSVYYIDKLAVAVKWQEVILIPVMAVIISFLSTLYPAFHASRLDPVEAIRYE
ncbi:MAG: lipoprotein-releasing ABC transporter permease subunit [Candidatus Goldbacteria bacterium]|nr:lipoprotein-releasing ABC transporter permease subunit [Candidatus Goldiibacteriota bacterium]